MSFNPKHVGPGYWANWHTTSLIANSKELKDIVAKSIVLAIETFPCKNPCRSDFIKYIKANPLLPAVKSNDPLSLFKWTVNAHNYVNEKLGKNIYNWQEAKEAWEGKEGICFENCGLSEDEIVEENVEFIVKSY